MKCKYLLLIFAVISVSLISCVEDTDNILQTPRPISWTIMYYANGDNNLEDYILSDLKEMELAEIPENVTVIALVDRPSVSSGKFGSWSDTKLFHVMHGVDEDILASEEIDSVELSLTSFSIEELNMCDVSVISNFVSFCKNNYKSDKYALILGSHGDGWKLPSVNISKSIGYDSTSKNISVSIENLASVLRNNYLDVIIFDACNMGNLETLYILKDCAQYIVASPNPLPLKGFGYTDAFSRLNTAVTSLNLVKKFTESWQKINDDVTMMVYSMDEFNRFCNSDNDYFNEICNFSRIDAKNSLAVRNNSIRYSVNSISDHIDIVNYINLLVPDNSIPWTSFIITLNTPKLSFYFPSTAAGFETGYNYTLFAIDTSWNDVLMDILP